MQAFRREYLLRLPLPLAQLYSRAHNATDPRGRHDNTFYLFEALIKLTAAPAIAEYLDEVERGAPRSAAIDKLLLQLALPSLGQWVGMLRELARRFGARPDAASHPLGHLWSQLTTARRDLPGALALYRRIKNGPDAAPAGDQSCSVLQLLEALVQYRNAVFGHGAARLASFYEREMGPLLFPAANDVLAEGTLDALGPRGSRLVYLTELRALDDGRVEVGIRELVGREGERAAALQLPLADVQGLAPNRVAVLWPGRSVPLRLDPLLVYREGELAEEVLFLNRDRDGRQVEYLSYLTGRTERDRATGAALAALLSRAAGRPVSEGQLQALADQSRAGAPPVESILPSSPPTASRLGDFEVQAEIGRGGMGVVYLARQLSLGRLVALKMLPAQLAGDPTALARFRREIRALARCDHPNIVKVLASGSFPDGRIYYAMEYVPGCDLEMVWRELSGSTAAADPTHLGGSTWAQAVLAASRKRREQTVAVAAVAPRWFYARGKEKVGPVTLARLRELAASGELKLTDMLLREGASRWAPAAAVEGLFNPPSAAAGKVVDRPAALPPLPERPPAEDEPGGYVRRVVRMMHDAALALQAVHDQRLIHRDVKPSNLMLTPDGSRVVLMDFGLAKGKSLATSASRAGGLLGTLRYAAPEQLAAATLEVGPSADVRGLGVTLWELLTRRRLFADAQDETQLAQMVHDEEVPRLRAVDPGFDADLEAIVARATERRAADRIPTASLAADYLQMYLDGQPLPIRPPGPRELLGRWVRAHRGLVASAAAILAIALVATVFAFVLVTQEKNKAIKLAGEKDELATTNANLAAKEQQAKESAEKSADESKKRLGQAYASRGMRSWEEGRHAEALLYFAEALRYDHDDAARARVHQGRLAAFWGHFPKVLHVWRHEGKMTWAAFSPDGRRIVTGDSDGAVQLWDADTGAPLLDRPLQHKGSIRLAFFSADGRRLLSLANLRADTPDAAAKSEVRVWDLAAKRSVPLQMQLGKDEEVLDAACNTDGSRVLVRISESRFGAKNRLVLCDAATSQPYKLPGEGEDLERALFSADGRRLFTLHRGGKAKVRDAMTGAVVSQLGNVPGTLQSVALTPDGRYCLTASERAVIVWDAVTGLAATPGGGIKINGKCEAAWMSSDGRLVAVAQEGGLVSAWTVSTGERIGADERDAKPVQHNGAVEDVIFNPDKKSLLSLDVTGPGFEPRFGGLGGQGGPGRLGGEVRRPVIGGLGGGLAGLAGLAGNIGGSPAPTNGYVRQWEPDNFDPSRVEIVSHSLVGGGLQGHAGGDARSVPTLPLHQLTQSATLSPDGLLALTVGRDQVAVWDLSEGRLATPYLNCDEDVRAAWLSPDGHRLLTLTHTQARLWSLAGDNLPALRLEHDAPVQAVSCSPDGAQIATVIQKERGDIKSEVRLWDATGQPAGPARTYNGEAFVTFTPAGPRVVTTGAAVQVWDATTGKQVGSTLKHEGPASVLGFTNQGQRLFTTVPGKDQSSSWVAAIYAWDLEKGELLYDPIRGGERNITKVTVEGEGRFLVTIASWQEGKQQRSEVKVWDTATGRPVGKALRLDGGCFSAAVNQEGERVLTFAGLGARQWRLWDVVSGEPLTGAERLGDSGALSVWEAQFSPDGRMFVTWAGSEASLRDAASGRVVHVLPHRAPVQKASYSPDGRRIVTGTATSGGPAGDTGTAFHEVRIWDASTGEPVSPPIRDRSALGVMSPDGEYVVLVRPFRQLLLPGLLLPGPGFEVYHVGSSLPVTPLLAGSPVSFSANGKYLLYDDENRPRILNLFPEKHTPEEWADLARLLSSARLDRSDTAMPLQTEDSRRLWERFHAAAPEYFAATSEAQAAWHLHEIRRCKDREAWFGVAWHLERLGMLRQLSPEEQYELGRARFELGEIKRKPGPGR
ncbi:MAG TPA: protein kinase [Gemmataceae bacterium]|nr:protein kinase [Gemmataceae bacterium]